jgi:hypothetical protein
MEKVVSVLGERVRAEVLNKPVGVRRTVKESGTLKKRVNFKK